MIPRSIRLIRAAPGPFDGQVVLDYDSRLLRRKRLACAGGDFMVDLAEVSHQILPFRPKGGTYGHGRTFGYDRGQGHSHDRHHDHA